MITSISCPVCQNLCSSEAVSCPKCGHPFNQGESVQSRQTQKDGATTSVWKYLTIGLGVVILGVIAFVLLKGFYDRSRDASNHSNLGLNDNTFTRQQQKNPTPEQLATLDITAGIDYQMGGVQPITSEKFYLLDSDLEQILKSSGMKANPQTGYLGTFGMAVKYSRDSADNKKAVEALTQHIKYNAVTDLQGKARFTNVRPNTYYLYGFSVTRGGFAIWNRRVDIKAGANSEIIDGKNAALAF